MDIGKILEKVIINSGYSKTQFAKELDISKSFMLRVINGEKKLSEAMLMKILSSSIITEKEKQPLRHKYFSERFGKENFDRVLFMLNKLNMFESNILNKETVYVREDILHNSLYRTQHPYTIGNKEELYEIISFFFKRMMEHKNPFFYSNFSFDQERLNTILYTLFSERDLDKPINFIHIISQHKSITNYEVSSIFEIVKWSTIMLNTYSIPGNPQSNSDLFPFYIITNDYVMIFSYDCRQGLVFTDQATIDYYKNYFSQISSNISPLCQFIEEELSVVDMMSQYEYAQTYALDGSICLGPALDYDILSKIAKQDLENREFLINYCLKHYQKLLNFGNLTLYHSQKSLVEFAENGRLFFVSDKYMDPLSPNMRARLLKNLKVLMCEHEDFDFYLINENKLSLPSNMTIDHLKDITLVTHYFKNTSSIGNKFWGTILFLDSPYYSMLFKNLQEYIMKNNFLYTNEYALDFIDTLIMKCDLSDK